MLSDPKARIEALWTSEEVADFVHMSRDALYQARRRGIGPRGIRIGGRVLFRTEDVQAWLDSRHEPEPVKTGGRR